MHERMKKIPICTSSEGQRNFTYPQKYSSSKLNQKFDSLTHFLRRKGLPEGHEFELKLQIGTSVMARQFSKNGLSDLWLTGALVSTKEAHTKAKFICFPPHLENERHFLTSRRFSRSSPQSSSTFLCSCSPSIKKIDDEIFSMT